MYLIWTLINTALVILFWALVLTLFSKGKKLFDNKYGNAIIVLFVIGVIGMLSFKEIDAKDNRYVSKTKIDQKDRDKIVSVNKRLENNSAFHISLHTRYLEEADKVTLLSGYATRSGFTSGFQWKSGAIVINKNKAGEVTYQATGILKWNLLGINIYTESKYYEGTFEETPR